MAGVFQAVEEDDGTVEPSLQLLHGLGSDVLASLDRRGVTVPGDAVAGGEPERGACGCSVLFEGLDPEHHAWLLGLEERGFAGAVELLGHLAVELECGHEDGRLHWSDVTSFVAHNWRDPVAMLDFASTVTTLLCKCETADEGQLAWTARRAGPDGSGRTMSA